MDIQLDIEAETARTACHFGMHRVQTKFPKLYLVGATYAGPYETMEDQG